MPAGDGMRPPTAAARRHDVPVPAPGFPASRRFGRLARKYSFTGRVLTECQVWRLSRRGGAPEFSVCQALAVSGSTAVDVGASVGNFTRGLAKAVGRHGRVIALEASPGVYEELIRSTWGARVVALNLAASSGPGWAELSVPVDGRGTHDQLGTLERRATGRVQATTIRTVRVDDLLGTDRPVSVIKIDVEGHEAEVIAGAAETLERHRPALVVEIEQRHLVGRSVSDVVESVLDRGYVCYGLRGRALVAWSEFDLVRDQLSWLGDRGDLAASIITDAGRYINNFVFLPVSRADAAVADLNHVLRER